VQFAKAGGATVLATAGTATVAYVLSVGADEVIDYQKESFEMRIRGIDVVLDLVGGGV
jgi:NADPH:quinone reductase-like Zn-dependent oxidoreductase